MPNLQAINRKKRFVLLNHKRKRLKGFWFAREGEPLTISYHYSKEMLADSDFVERVGIAAEGLSSLKIVRLVYKPVGSMGVYAKNDTLDIKELQKKYHNAVLIQQHTRDEGKLVYCQSNIHPFYILHELYISSVKDDHIILPPFAQISCNIRGLHNLDGGLLLHEFFHLLGIQHAHTFSDTNGILSIQGYIPDFFSIEKGKYAEFMNLYGYYIGPQFLSYTPLSPFSIQHYRLSNLAPVRILNKTRVTEILTGYHFSSELQRDYFYLLEKYAGYPYLLTYQDLSALVMAVYIIAPKSMLNRDTQLPYYYFVPGIYVSASDKKKWIYMLEAFQRAENFSYPILAKENLGLTVDVNHIFSESLIKLLRIIYFEGKGITCSLQESVHTSVELRLAPDCKLMGRGQRVGSFEFNMTISNGVRRIQRTIKLNIIEKTSFKNHVLLGKKNNTYLLHSNASIDLIDLCEANAVPAEKDLRCHVFTESFSDFDDLTIDNCFIKSFNKERNYTFQVDFFNGEANKTCRVALVSSKDPLDRSLNATHVDDVLIRRVREVDNIASFVVSTEDNKPWKNVVFETANNSNWPREFNYLLTIPFSHGIFEALVDSIDLHAYSKGLLRLLPRISLVYFGYSSFLGFSLVCFASLIEHLIKANMSSTWDQYSRLIHFTGFFILSELEYGFSHLWELADRIEFWPVLTDKLNQLFTQALWAPMIKTMGYLLTSELIASCSPWLLAKKETMEVESLSIPMKDTSSQGELKDTPLSFFDAIRVAANTVFSKKIRVICPFFSGGWGSANSQPEETAFRLKAQVVR